MKYFEDIEIGQVQRAGPMVLTESAIIEFASQWDPFPFHTDVQKAEESMFGGLTASNCHTVCVACRLLHDVDLPAVVAALGHQYRYPNPARVGDELALESTTTDKRESKSRPDRGIVTGEHRLVNQHGTVVLEMTSTVMVAKRPT